MPTIKDAETLTKATSAADRIMTGKFLKLMKHIAPLLESYTRCIGDDNVGSWWCIGGGEGFRGGKNIDGCERSGGP